MFLIIMLAASTFAVVTRVASSIWISGHHLLAVASSRSVSFIASLTWRSKKAYRSSTLAGLVAESTNRTASFTPQAATSSCVGPSVANTSSTR